MSYVELPNNRLIVNGVDLTQEFKMVLADGYTLSPPEPKVYTVDIPGGHGVLDLTESLFGDVTYKNRKQEFTMYIVDVEYFEQIKTKIKNLLHGKSFDYKLTMDPDYTYHGRFTITETTHGSYNQGIVGMIKIGVDADPFKYKKPITESIDAVAGTIVYLDSGRRRVKPTIDTKGYLKVIYNGKQIILTHGTWNIADLIFEQGLNELYLNSYSIHKTTWGDLKRKPITWKEFGKNRLFEWYKWDQGTMVLPLKWADFEGKKWSDLYGKTWIGEIFKEAEITEMVDDITITYDWGDL